MDQEEFLRLARERFDFGRLADAEDRVEAEYDNAFANASNKDLGQWDKNAKGLRKKHKRPVLQWNRVPVYVQQVVNDGRQNKPSIRVAPGPDGEPHTAEYLQARIRHIEYEANADTAKDTARDQQVTSGRGFIRVGTEYIPGTFDQRVTLDRIENQFSVIWDPASVQYDRSDADWCFVISLISKDAHERKYGKASVVNRLDFAEAMQLAPDWIGIGDDSEMIQIAEYYVKEYKPRTLCLLGSTGLPAWKDDIAEVYEQLQAQGLIIEEREEPSPTIIQYCINGAEVLEKTEWIGSTIPIIPVWGREATINGKRRTFSLTRNAQGPQQLLNLYVSNLAEFIGQMPKTPWTVPVGGIPAASERDWANANNSPLAYLLYEQFDSQGRPINPPNRLLAEPPIQALVIGINQCIDGIKAAMGIYDASLGAQSNETSGIAIQRRRQQSNVTNYHFPDNEARSNKYLGQILVEILPKLDKKGGVYPVRTEDGKTHLVPIGVEHKDWKTGQIVVHDLKKGQYGVTVSTGPSYQSQRQEAYDRDAALVQANPELMWAIGPQMFRSDDTAGAEERADAIERYINFKIPGLLPKKDEQQAIPQQVQQQIAQLQQELQKTQGFAQSLHEQLTSRKPELDNQRLLKQMDIDFQREKLQTETQIKWDVAAMQQGIAADIAGLREQIAVLKHERGLEHQKAMSDQQYQQGIEQMQMQQQMQPPEESEEASAEEPAEPVQQ